MMREKLNALTVMQLREMIKDLELPIDRAYKLRKAELIDAIIYVCDEEIKTYKVEFDDENFEIVKAKSEIDASLIADEMAEERGVEVFDIYEIDENFEEVEETTEEIFVETEEVVAHEVPVVVEEEIKQEVEESKNMKKKALKNVLKGYERYYGIEKLTLMDMNEEHFILFDGDYNEWKNPTGPEGYIKEMKKYKKEIENRSVLRSYVEYWRAVVVLA